MTSHHAVEVSRAERFEFGGVGLGCNEFVFLKKAEG